MARLKSRPFKSSPFSSSSEARTYLRSNSGTGALLLDRGVVEEADAELELLAVIVLGQRRELAFAGDAVPCGFVQGAVTGWGFENHVTDLAIPQDRKADAGDSLLQQRGLDLFGN